MALTVRVLKDGVTLAEYCVMDDNPVGVAIKGLDEHDGAEVAEVICCSKVISRVYGSRMNGEISAPMYGREQDEVESTDGNGLKKDKWNLYEKLWKILGFAKRPAYKRQG